VTLSLTNQGFDYVAYYNGAYENADSLDALAATGANSVEASLDYGIDPQTSTVYADSSYTDSLSALGATIKQAVGLGLSVMVRPLIDFVDPSDLTGTPYSVGEWRTYFNPGAAGSASANAFFASYQTMIMQEAQIAVANGATSLCIGTELDQITGPAYKSYWDSIIGALRADDPTLKLTYAADWDDDLSPWQWGGTGLAAGTGNLATQVSFASELDSIGVDCYAPISDAANPTLPQLIAGWTQTPTDPTSLAVTGGQSLISYFESVAAAVGKPLIFTELGYENATDAASQPAGSSTNVVDSSLQAELYQAFFAAWQQAGNSSLTGVYFWNWDPNAAEVGPGNGTNFSPQGEAALGVATAEFSAVAPSLAITNSSELIDSATQIITGTINSADAGLPISIYDGTELIGITTADVTGTWTANVTLSGQDPHVLTAQAINVARELGVSNAQYLAIGGGDAIVFASGSGNAASLYSTGGSWDWVGGSNGTVYLTSAQASVTGGGDAIVFASGSGNAASLYSTNGNWDWVGGPSGTVYLTSAQTTVTGGGDAIDFGSGSGNAASLYSTGGNWDWVGGPSGTVYLTSAQTSVTGGGDAIVFGSGSGNAASLYSTGGNWDWVGGSNGTVYLTSAQATVTGGGDAIVFGSGSGNAASLYSTGGDWDWVGGSNGTIYLTSAQATVTGTGDTLDLSGTSFVTANGGSDAFVFGAAIGTEVINGFAPTDTIQFSKSDFASWSALSSHMTQSGANTVITLNSSNTVTLDGVTATTLTTSEFKFV
jgi:uncharacterized membrane protein YdcZ (DUF606 family)